MSFSSPSPPPAPNPYAVAQAQQQANISVAIANTYMQNANVISPQGTSTFAQSGTFILEDPQYSGGSLVSTTDREIPIFTQTISLTPKGQSIFDANQDMQLALNTIGRDQLTRLNDTLGTPFTLATLPQTAQNPSAPSLNQVISQPGTIQLTVGDADTTANRDAVTNSIIARLDYQLGVLKTQHIDRLANMGIFPGSEAYENEIRTFDFQFTDGHLQAILSGGQEQTRLFQIEHMKGKFKNEALDLDFRQKMLVVDFSNRTSIQRFSILMQVADFINTFRERRLQELLTERNQPLNELSIMLHGGQISIPQYTGFKAGAISDTPLGQYVYQSAAIEQQQYQTKVKQQEAMIGGIAQLGGAVLAAPMTGGGSVAGAMMGGLLR